MLHPLLYICSTGMSHVNIWHRFLIRSKLPAHLHHLSHLPPVQQFGGGKHHYLCAYYNLSWWQNLIQGEVIYFLNILHLSFWLGSYYTHPELCALAPNTRWSLETLVLTDGAEQVRAHTLQFVALGPVMSSFPQCLCHSATCAELSLWIVPWEDWALRMGLSLSESGTSRTLWMPQAQGLQNKCVSTGLRTRLHLCYGTCRV